MRPFLPEPDLSERIHDAVLDAICSGELKAGARLTQEELAQQFGVSRQPVLQAMMLLRREGFLVESGRKGVCVASLDVQQARNLYVVRGALDGAAARLAAANYTPHLVQRGRQLLEVGRRAVASGNIPSVIEADIDFHLFLGGRVVLVVIAVEAERIFCGSEKSGQVPSRRTLVQALVGEICILQFRTDQIATKHVHNVGADIDGVCHVRPILSERNSSPTTFLSHLIV